MGTKGASALRRGVVGVVGLALAMFTISGGATTATAGNGSFPQAFNPETAAGFTNTFSTISGLNPACPQALAGTPGSDPASKVLNQSLNTAASFLPGGTVHYTYLDNPQINGGTANFTIQDCLVVYPAGFFPAGSVDPTTGVVTGGVTKAQLSSGGTPIDGASLSGISAPNGPIYFSWTSPTTLTAQQWVCNFARDIMNNHGGGGNRKVPPTCFQVGGPPVNPNVPNPPDVFVGYADAAHAVGFVQTPNPWQGAPNTIFVGCDPGTTSSSACGVDDTGALRILNTNTGPGGVGPGDDITVTSAMVTITKNGLTCVFNPWGTLNVTVHSGQSLILSQTSDTSHPQPANCDTALNPTPFYNFDSSEEPGEPMGGPVDCTTLSDIPQIQVTVNNTTVATSIASSTMIPDTTRVLSTGGTDRGDCGKGTFGPNGFVEASDWVHVFGP